MVFDRNYSELSELGASVLQSSKLFASCDEIEDSPRRRGGLRERDFKIKNLCELCVLCGESPFSDSVAAVPRYGEYLFTGNLEERQKKGGGIPSVPFFNVDKQRLQELYHKILVNLLGAAQRFTVDHQNRNRLGAGQRDQFGFVFGVFPDIFLDDFIFAVKIGHAIEHALGKTTLAVEVEFQRHSQLKFRNSKIEIRNKP